MAACNFDRASKFVLQKFGLDHFKDVQKHALEELFMGKDVFVNQPTGSGKSLIFQAMPLMYDYMYNINANTSAVLTGKAIAIVISPLVSLMQDQEAFLQNKQWRSMLSNSVYKKNLKLIAVDEAHCISHWGFAPRKGEKIFRVWFGRINEIRSIILSSVPVLALTATATMKTRDRIISTLEMKNVTLIKENPDRCNIAYAVQIVGNNTLENFESLIAEIKKNGLNCDRVVIYCQTIKAVTMVYGHFEAELGIMMYKDRNENPKERLVEMFHARTDELNKNHILESFAHENGYVRVVIATIAYGIGIDCKGVKTVIHYGPSRNLESYLQESGRAGRSHDSCCKAIILFNNVMLKHCSEDIVDYVHNQTQCRRAILLSHFDVASTDIIPPEHPHLCCDICQRQCACIDGQCEFSFITITMPLQKDSDPNVRCRLVDSKQMLTLESKLEYLENSYFKQLTDSKGMSHTPLLTPVNLLCGFCDLQRNQVIEHCNKLFTLRDIYSYVDIWQPCVAFDILYVMHIVFKDVDIDENPHDELDDIQCPPELEIPEEYAQFTDDEDD